MISEKSLAPIACLFVLVACKGGGGGSSAPATPPAQPLPLSQQFTIDGVVDFSALPGVREQTLPFTDAGTGAFVKNTTLRWAVVNDDKELYLAMEWNDDSWNNSWSLTTGPVDVDSIQVLFDGDGNGSFDLGEDARQVVAGSVSSFYIDQHKSAGDSADLIGDGYGRLHYDGISGKYQAEILIPMANDAQGQDGPITSATRYNFVLYDHLVLANPSANVARLFTSDSDSSSWETLPLTTATPAAHAQIPTGLTGLIVFISEHEDPKGEIYTFNPASGVVTRVTNNSLFEDCVSLSPDRTHIAFHGAPSLTDYGNYEIYMVRVDGSDFQQLTSNAFLDGHPAWSPDGTKLAYASFRDPGLPNASIVLMTTAGSELADLTPLPFDDNDPEFLPDGRIVFKTTRWSAQPLVKIAVMNADGSGAYPVTLPTSSAGSDHDPVSDGSFVIFERFLKGTDYTTDVESGFTPWDIVEAPIAGGPEHTVLHNGWVNWLPVYDPTHHYIAFQKSCGYTSVHLMTREGVDLGRLIPGITKIRYIDWK